MTSLLLAAVLAAPTVEPATVTIEPRTVRSIGGVTELDRRQFLTIHATPGDGDITDDEHRWLNEHLQVSYGRDGGYQSWMMTTIPADPSNPDMPDVAFMAEAGAEAVRERQSSPRYTPQFWRDVILCTHPETTVARPDNTHTTWGPRTIDAAAEFTAQFLRHYYDDQTRPTHIEVFNEPFIKIRSLGSSVQAMSQQHITTARRIRELNPDVQVGGYSAAWMEVEARDFAHWNGWMKTFIDIAGAEMDFLSYHVYDGSNAGGADANRTGSNSEALL
ncbi:MAG: beta-agarase, partial [Planctomycetota bacterium]